MHTGVAGIHIPGPASVRLGTATQALCGLHTRLSTVLYSRSLQNSALHSVRKLAGLRTSSRQQARQSRHSAQHRAARAPGVRTVAFMAQPKFGKTIVQEAKGVHAATVFVMHGLGDSGEGLAHIGPSLALPHVKFVYPTAPEREITMNGGERRNGWFDIYHPDLMNVRDAPAIGQSIEYVKGLVRDEIAAGTPADRIVIGGFSQGGHIALRTASSLHEPIAGAIGLSTWCEAPEQPVPVAVQQMPVFVGHGDLDPLVPVQLARQTALGLKKAGLRNTELHTYPGVGHHTSPAELQDLRRFLLRLLPEKLPTREEVDAMSVKELRAFLGSHGVSTTGFLEKKEFVTAARQVLQR